ncbi:DMT family transporter, partial [Patescibacteria group bacterium]|nr:DMT family transporter [Patescibacteria group bacterium]
MYILIATIGFSALAVVSILDKFILTKKTTDPALYAFYSTIFALPLCLVFPFIALPYGFEVWIFSIVAGLFYGVALWTMYKGIEKGEVSHVGPLVGAAVPLFSIFLGGFFLKEVLSPYQIIAIAFLIFGSFILAFEKRKKGQGLRAGTAFGFLAGLIFAVSLVSL